ncbi:MAG: DUF6320 domain-containing protein [Oscillospiraceae bacterium]
MKYCDKCKVTVRNNLKQCPLCQQILQEKDNTPSQQIYPKVTPIYKQYSDFLKLVGFICAVISVLSIIINLTLPATGYWSIAVLGGVICFIISLSSAITKWSNPPKNIMFQVIIVSLAAVGWDFFTGFNGWSIDYVIPCICVSAMVSMAIISKVFKQSLQDYMLYWILDVFFGLVPIIFLASNLVKVKIPSLICIAISLIFLAALAIFEGANLLDEIKKRFHL